MWKEFDLSRNPRNGGDVLAKDVDGHHGGELRKKTFVVTKENSGAARHKKSDQLHRLLFLSHEPNF